MNTNKQYVSNATIIVFTVIVYMVHSTHAVYGTPMDCKWSKSELPMYIDEASFSTYGYNFNEVKSQLINAADTWFINGGAPIKFKYTGTTEQCGIPGALVVRMEEGPAPDCRLAGAYDWCNAPAVVFFHNGCNGVHNWTTDYPDAGEYYLFTVAVHEFGHVHGLNHSTAQHAAMGAYYSMEARWLWNDDIDVLRNDATYGYGQRSTQYLRQRYSTNLVSWHSHNDTGDTSNLSPAIAFGYVASAGKYCLAWTGTDYGNNIYSYRGNGITWDAGTHHTTGGYTRGGVSMTYGNGKFVLIHTAYDDSRQLYYQTSTDCNNWSTPQPIADAYSHHKPALGYDGYSNRFVIAWSDISTSEIKFMTTPAGTISWGNLNPTSTKTLDGPSIGMRSGSYYGTINWTGTDSLNHVYTNGVIVSGGVASFFNSQPEIDVYTTRENTAACHGYINGVTEAYAISYRGTVSANNLYYAHKDGFSTYTPYHDQGTILSPILAGPHMAYGNTWQEYVVSFVQ